MQLNEVLLYNITALIQKYGLSESSCLSSCKIHNNFLSNLKNGSLQKPCFEHIYAIAKFFNVSIDSLADYEMALEYMMEPKSAINRKDGQIMAKAYTKLDVRGQFTICEVMKREKQRMIDEKKYENSESGPQKSE